MNGIETILVFAGLIIVAWQASNLVALYFGISYFRSPKNAIKDVLELAEIKSGERFFELGSGWGEILAYASKKYGVKAFGIEVSPLHYFVSLIINYSNELVKIRWADLRDFTFNKADIIYCNMTPRLLKKMEKKFLEELKPGTRLIIFSSQLTDIEPKFTYQAGKNKINFYQF